MYRYLFLILQLTLSNPLFSQHEERQIKESLLNYIEGTSYNRRALIDKAFYSEANLYLENQEKGMRVVPVDTYMDWFKSNQGQFNGRVGNILSIDHFNTIATAKAEILIPAKNLRFVDMFLLKKIDNEWKIVSKSASSESSNLTEDRVLFVVSNAHFYGNSELPAGNSFSEIVIAYNTFKEAGYNVDFVSPKGGSIPIAYINTSNDMHKQYLYDLDFMYKLKHTKSPKEVLPENYKAIQYIGGGSAMFGVPENEEVQKIAMSIYEDHNGIISSVCHGTAGIVNLRTKDGEYLVKGKNVNGYPDVYERHDAEYYKEFPFNIQKTIEKHGGAFKFSPRNTEHVEIHGNLVTGQNYLSSRAVALEIIRKLKTGNVGALEE
ncbi:nuclear transport factor 2 family protein [Fulvivirga sp. 29W222]|uniref:Nuclear transport factor 2 family protein n=1 Tax=Fulvivirga marina TaxID=2494733 RepID=A0A937G095_9BACT|nr:nuclear transport factor 2 family protein [Fulvivirga marina]MBL6448137.1 nuclear transport factor 2 family protein [Fulvivirga marina]